VARHFHAVRVSRAGPIPDLPRRPVIVVLNHPSWWDPMIGVILTGTMPAWREHFAPIDAVGLDQYRFLARLGFFGIAAGTAAGARRFLQTSLSILARPESALWITAEGEFVDVRERPTRLRPGIGHLAHRVREATIVPTVIEYPFWNDRCPEVLVRFGRPIEVGSDVERPAAEWTALVERGLQDCLDALAEESQRRDPALFTTLVHGTAGVGGVYDIGRRVRAWLGGSTFRAEHVARPGDVDGDRPAPDPPGDVSGRTPRR
jgi:1-acyl-sn-glycerol-3-phosphate acyltransferase